MSNLHEDSIIIDGLNISKFDRSVFEETRKLEGSPRWKT